MSTLPALAVDVSQACGFPVRANPFVPRTSAILTDDDVIVLHPLAVLGLIHEGDPLAQLDAAMDWIVEQASLELDALHERLDGDPGELASAMISRSQEWANRELNRGAWESDGYDDGPGYDRSLVLEDPQAWLYAAVPGTERDWAPIDMTKPAHRAAVRESKRRELVVFGEFEEEEDTP